jgi:ferredoxin
VASVLKGLEALNEISEKEADTLWRIGEYDEERRLTCQLEIVKDTDVIELQTD